MNYTFHPERISFVKKDPDGKVLLCLNRLQNRVVLNKTSHEIIELLPNFGDTEALQSEIQKRYPSVDTSRIQKDLLEVMNLFDIYGIVEMNKVPCESAECYIVGDDSDTSVNSVGLSVLRENNFYYCREAREEYFDPPLMRYRVMRNIEYGVYVQDGSEITSYMTFCVVRPDVSAALNIGSFFFSKKLDEKTIVENFVRMINKIVGIIAVHRCLTKVRFMIPKKLATEKIVRILSAVGFTCEYNFANESTLGDVTYYSLSIDSNE